MKVPGNISDKKMNELRRRAEKAERDMFSRRAVRRRIAMKKAHKNARWN